MNKRPPPTPRASDDERTIYRLHIADSGDLEGHEFSTQEAAYRWLAQPYIASAHTTRSNVEPRYTVRPVRQTMGKRRCPCCGGLHWVDDP